MAEEFEQRRRQPEKCLLPPRDPRQRFRKPPQKRPTVLNHNVYRARLPSADTSLLESQDDDYVEMVQTDFVLTIGMSVLWGILVEAAKLQLDKTGK